MEDNNKPMPISPPPNVIIFPHPYLLANDDETNPNAKQALMAIDPIHAIRK